MRNITRDDLIKMEDRDDDYVLVNVLSAESFSEKHIPGSINVPVTDQQFAQTVQRHVNSKDSSVVVYCGGPQCQASHEAGLKLEQAGFTNVFRYVGGLSDWENSGLRLDSATVTASR